MLRHTYVSSLIRCEVEIGFFAKIILLDSLRLLFVVGRLALRQFRLHVRLQEVQIKVEILTRDLCLRQWDLDKCALADLASPDREVV